VLAEATKLEEDIVTQCFDKSIYINMMANLLGTLKKRPTFDRAKIEEDERLRGESLPPGVSINVLQSLCHPREILLANDYPHSVQFEELLPKLELPGTQRCSRCGTDFNLDSRAATEPELREVCTFHGGRTVRGTVDNPERVYSCCSRTLESSGCTKGPHVFELRRYMDLREVSGIDFVTTKELFDRQLLPQSRRILALDCEMSYTLLGMELTRLSLVDPHGVVIINEHVRPATTVIDYNTRFSGVTARHLEEAKLTFDEARALFLQVVDSDAILVGHSLESDLKALRVVHERVIDTALLFPTTNPKYKHSLKLLTKTHLKRLIQVDVEGHDSVEDAQAAMDLVLLYAKEEALRPKKK